MTKQQEEMAYLRFIEDMCRFAFSSPTLYPALLAVKTSLHKSFITQPKILDAVVQGIKSCVDKVREGSPEASLEFLDFALTRISLKAAPKDSSVKKPKEGEVQQAMQVDEEEDAEEEVKEEGSSEKKKSAGPTKHVEGLKQIGMKRKQDPSPARGGDKKSSNAVQSSGKQKKVK